jgi:hypothetical protein
MKRVMPLVAALFLWTHSLFAMDLPTAPPGYPWQEIPEIKAALLKPTGWHFKRESKKGTLAYFITKEDTCRDIPAEPDFLVNALFGFAALPAMSTRLTCQGGASPDAEVFVGDEWLEDGAAIDHVGRFRVHEHEEGPPRMHL